MDVSNPMALCEFLVLKTANNHQEYHMVKSNIVLSRILWLCALYIQRILMISLSL